MLHVTIHDSRYLKIFVHHEGEPTSLLLVLRKCTYLDSSQRYKRHYNRFINIFKHC